MSNPQRTELPADLAALNERLKAILAVVKADEARFGMDALISAYVTQVYRTGLHLRAASCLRQLSSVMEAYGTRQDLTKAAVQNGGRIPVPDDLPAEVPEGYSAADTIQIKDLCVKLAALLGGYANHVGMSALVTMYGQVATCTGDLRKAGEFLVKVGNDLVAEAAAPADSIPAPTSTRVH